MTLHLSNLVTFVFAALIVNISAVCYYSRLKLTVLDGFKLIKFSLIQKKFRFARTGTLPAYRIKHSEVPFY